ncbi:transposase [Rufibacter tibetensis]|uniref:transposase n=1 Tax=Rufibacter tibetensis TaxID=512763 RepID=UPI0009FAE6AB|nr:transposase [Rufibacter tibetensis]
MSARGARLQLKPSAVVGAILYRPKTGYQWRELPARAFFGGSGLSWQGVYRHFRKWAAGGSLRKAWAQPLKSRRRLLDLSSTQLDGRQTLSKDGGEHVGYQARKAAKTCNSLSLSDSRGTLLAGSGPP